MKNLVGQTLGGYAVLEQLGAGGMGAVFKARQPVLDRIVALKVIAPQVAQDACFIARFQHEAKSAARLNHPHIVQVYAAGEDAGTHFMVSEFVEGESLQQRLNREGKMEPQEALAICVFVAEGLKYAWNEAQIIHRDIKPANIFLSNKGAVKVGDLGLAKSVALDSSAALTQSGVVVGTPFYCSPEQARGGKEIDFRADIYSLGCTLYHMVSGKKPYETGQEQSPMSIMVRQIHDPPPAVLKVLPTCLRPVVRLLNKMLAKHPDDRHASYDELIADLRRVHDMLGQSQPITPPARPAAAGKPAARICAAVAAAVVAGAAGVSVWAPWKERASAEKPAGLRTPEMLPSHQAVALPPEPLVTTTTTQRKQASPVAPGTATLMAPPAAVSARGDVLWTNSLGMQFLPVPGTGVKFSKYETRVRDFESFVRATGYDATLGALTLGVDGWKSRGGSWSAPGFAQTPEHPVCCVSWEDAKAFCRWLTEKERSEGRLRADEAYRLPTDSEWSVAVSLSSKEVRRLGRKSAGPDDVFPWGTAWPPPLGAGNYAGEESRTLDTPADWQVIEGYRDDYPRTAPVGRFEANRFGLYDLGGNVWEWCEDFAPGNQQRRIFRGGGWSYDDRRALLSSNRGAATPNHRASYRGFRCVLARGAAPAVGPTP